MATHVPDRTPTHDTWGQPVTRTVPTTRRAVVRSAAWAAPVVLAATSAPAFATSGALNVLQAQVRWGTVYSPDPTLPYLVLTTPLLAIRNDSASTVATDLVARLHFPPAFVQADTTTGAVRNRPYTLGGIDPGWSRTGLPATPDGTGFLFTRQTNAALAPGATAVVGAVRPPCRFVWRTQPDASHPITLTVTATGFPTVTAVLTAIV
jgi:hypothetical protein